MTIISDRNLNRVNTVLAKLRTPLPVLHDRKSEVIDAYRGYALPTLYLVDQQQKIYGVWTGPLQEREGALRNSIKVLLE